MEVQLYFHMLKSVFSGKGMAGWQILTWKKLRGLSSSGDGQNDGSVENGAGDA